MKNVLKTHIAVTYILLLSFAVSDDVPVLINYPIIEGANLISFPLDISNYEINYFFSNDSEHIISDQILNNNIISLIGEGELAFVHNESWIGSLSEINTSHGYWIISDEPFLFQISGEAISNILYFLHPGGNLISYPLPYEQEVYSAIPLFNNNILAILGENKALFNNNGILMGSLSSFLPGRGYWFIVNDYTPFQYNESYSSNSNTNYDSQTERDDVIINYNQSTLQSAFFVKSIYISGEKNSESLTLNAICNNLTIGNSVWESEYSDLIAMGDDGFEWTEGYCSENQNIDIKIEDSEENLYFINSNKTWKSNDFEIITLSNCSLGDINFNSLVNVSDIILIIEHILLENEINNEHGLLLADYNYDELINVTDVILIVEQILDN